MKNRQNLEYEIDQLKNSEHVGLSQACIVHGWPLVFLRICSKACQEGIKLNIFLAIIISVFKVTTSSNKKFHVPTLPEII